MFLHALTQLYDRLAADPESGVAPYGYSSQRAAFCVVVRPDGKSFQIEPLTRQEGKKSKPTSIVVPGTGARSGTSAPPSFLWDNAAYLFGLAPKGKTKQWASERCTAFREMHLQYEGEIEDSAYSAFCKVLPLMAEAGERIDPALVSRYIGIVRVAGTREYLHQRSSIRKWWDAKWSREEAEKSKQASLCLVYGSKLPIAGSHAPKIKGVSDAPGKPSEKFLVAIDTDFRSADSYGKRKNDNAPISQLAAFKYCTALNWLLDPSRGRRLSIGDTSVVYWAAEPAPLEGWFAEVLNPSTAAEDDETRGKLADRLQRISRGELPAEWGDAKVPFYVLGLSPNAARISVRFWLQSTLGEMLENLGRHYRDLAIVPIESHDPRPPSVRDILGETVPPSKYKKPDTDRIVPTLAGDVMRSVLQARPYPDRLSQLVLRRIVAEGFADPDRRIDWRRARWLRAAVLRGSINRKLALIPSTAKEQYVTHALNRNHPNPAYQSGRILAVLAFVQELALGKVNVGVVRRYLSAASSNPSAYLGRLQIEAERGHFHKLRKNTSEFLHDELNQINGMISPDQMPSTLQPIETSHFVLGFYHELAYVRRGRFAENKLHRTRRGEWVQSGGERMLADALHGLGIPYAYEPRFTIRAGHSKTHRVPDFLIPGKNEADDVFIEWLGVNGPAGQRYAEDWAKKVEDYQGEGITEVGGERGTLRIIDAREDPKSWDDTRVIRQLCDWFPSYSANAETSEETEPKEV